LSNLREAFIIASAWMTSMIIGRIFTISIQIRNRKGEGRRVRMSVSYRSAQLLGSTPLTGLSLRAAFVKCWQTAQHRENKHRSTISHPRFNYLIERITVITGNCFAKNWHITFWNVFFTYKYHVLEDEFKSKDKSKEFKSIVRTQDRILFIILRAVTWKAIRKIRIYIYICIYIYKIYNI